VWSACLLEVAGGDGSAHDVALALGLGHGHVLTHAPNAGIKSNLLATTGKCQNFERPKMSSPQSNKNISLRRHGYPEEGRTDRL
jgi:hypothetical protein